MPRITRLLCPALKKVRSDAVSGVITGYLLRQDVSWLVVEAVVFVVVVVVSGLQFPADSALLPGAAVSVFDASVVASPGFTLQTNMNVL